MPVLTLVRPPAEAPSPYWMLIFSSGIVLAAAGLWILPFILQVGVGLLACGLLLLFIDRAVLV